MKIIFKKVSKNLKNHTYNRPRYHKSKIDLVEEEYVGKPAIVFIFDKDEANFTSEKTKQNSMRRCQKLVHQIMNETDEVIDKIETRKTPLRDKRQPLTYCGGCFKVTHTIIKSKTNHRCSICDYDKTLEDYKIKNEI